MTFPRAAFACILICSSSACTKGEPGAAPAEPGAIEPAAPPPAQPQAPAAAEPAAPAAAPVAPVAPAAPAAAAAPTPAPSPVAAEPSSARAHAAAAKSATERTAAAPAANAQPAAAPASPTPAPGAAAVTPCGEKGQPSCPLQAWMEDHMQRAVEAGDLPALAKALTRAATFTPDPSWNAGEQGWSAIAKAGAAAATTGDLEAAKQTCKSCHKTWRKKYKDEFRMRPVPN